jgi:hypothetical protein
MSRQEKREHKQCNPCIVFINDFAVIICPVIIIGIWIEAFFFNLREKTKVQIMVYKHRRQVRVISFAIRLNNPEASFMSPINVGGHKNNYCQDNCNSVFANELNQ